MKIRSKVKNTVLAGLAGLTLTACGGGGGGGASMVINNVGNFVNNQNFLTIEGASTVSSSFSETVSQFERMIPSAYNPTDTDKTDAVELLKIVDEVLNDWDIVEDILAGNDKSVEISHSERLEYYEMDEYKKAVSAIKYLRNVARPVIVKFTEGKTISDDEFKSIADDKTAKAHMDSYETESNNHVNLKKESITSKVTSVTETLEPELVSEETVKGTPEITYPDEWTYINGAGGLQQRTKTTTQTQTLVQKHSHCDVTTTIWGDGFTKDTKKVCNTKTTETPLEDLTDSVKITQMGENAVKDSIDVSPEPLVELEETEKEKVGDPTTEVVGTSSEEREGMASTDAEFIEKPIQTRTENNTKYITMQRYEKTTTTLPVTTDTYNTVNYKYTWQKKKRWKTTTYDWVKETYNDDTFNTIKNSDTVTYSDWEITTTYTEETKSELTGSTTVNKITTTEVAVGDTWVVEEGLQYTSEDQNLGTVTANMSTTVADHQTAEYNSNHGLGMINAADAYAKGWTGEGAVLGVIDTWQDTDHEKLDGKYLFYKDYDPYNGTVDEGAQGHGTFVASIIAGKRDGDSTDSNGRLTTGDYNQETYWENGQQKTRYTLTKNNDMHGVAFNSNLVGANVDRFSSGGISKSQAQNALHDFAKLKSPTSEGGEEMNIVAVNMSFNTPQLFYDANGSTVTQLNDGTYNASEIIARIQANGYGDSQYWKIATDNDIILVNSAGNYGFAHAGDPGIWAVETDSNGNLILGGKMVIVGNWDGTNVSGNKAGHVCLDINTANNTCNDTHRLSEFYILAPGTDILSAISNDRYTTGSGTSYAAPHVTGAFGVLNQMWPYMQGDKLVKLVMNTADKNLPGYDVNVHGQGLLDLDEATKPQGAVGLATSGRVDHPTVSLNNTYYATGTALPSSLSNLNIMVLDDYDRNYYINLGSSFVVQDKRKYSDVQMLVGNENTFLPHQQMYGSFAQGGQYELDKNYNFGFYTGEGGNGDYSLNVGKDFYLNNKFKLKTNIGHMSEQETWLGNESDGVLAVGDNNATTSASIGVAYQLGNNVLSLDYSKGKTDVNTVDNSLIKSFSDIETESYRLAYEIHKDTHTTFGWSFSLPSHITSGSMGLEVAESVNLDGTINYTNINSDLTQSTKEKNIGFFYNKAGEDELDASFNFTAEYRMDKSGVANNDGVEVGMNFVKKFAGNCKFLWMKNPKCFDKDGNMKSNLFGKTVDNATKHGLVYDLETDKFIPIKK